MATKYTTFLFFTFAIITTATSIRPVTTKPQKLTIKLLHYSLNDYSTFGIKSDNGLDRERVRFLVKFFMGDPQPVLQQTVMDTGSSFLWVQCDFCRSLPIEQRSRVLNPPTSDTYVTLPCEDPSCKEFPSNTCSDESICQYSAIYLKGASSGTVASELLSFAPSNQDQYELLVEDVKFGCQSIDCHKDDYIYNDPKVTGVFGLGAGRASFLAQMGYKQFSYCLGYLNDTNYQHNKLILGDGYLAGDSTPIEIWRDHYYVALEKIQVGDEPVLVDKSMFKITSSGGGGVLIDTGSQFTYLIDEAYYALRQVVKRELDALELKPTETTSHTDICYSGRIGDKLIGDFPLVTFTFAEGAMLELDAYSMFEQRSKTSFCMAIFPSSKFRGLGKRSLIGLMAQQNYNMGYDLASKTLYFEDIDCNQVD